VWIARPEEADHGIAMIVAGPERIGMKSFDQTVKNFMWGDLTAALMEAGEKGAKVPVLLDGSGNITEGPGFNVFVVRAGSLATPDTGVLHGITRRTAIELAASLNVETRIGPVAVASLREADEVFITSTAGGIMPVTSLDGEAVGDGGPGPVSQRLRQLYWQAHADPKYAEPVRYSSREAAE
jgi:branched-chain amino acid aminotransferase